MVAIDVDVMQIYGHEAFFQLYELSYAKCN